MEVDYIEVNQNNSEKIVMFSAPAGFLWQSLAINKKEDDKEEGYQRVLSDSRAMQIAKYIKNGNNISPALVVTLEKKKIVLDEVNKKLKINNTKGNVGWIIDGQHRLRGAWFAKEDGYEIEVPVVAFIGLSDEKQIEQFVTINKEAKGVPTSLYYDLLKRLPSNKSPSDIAKEKSASIADQLRKNKASVFFDKIVVVTAPRAGQISLTNFARKVYPLLVEPKGFFAIYSQKDFAQILENYFSALKVVFNEEFVSKRLFFKTLGFGAMMNCLHTVFLTTLSQTGGFRLEDCLITLRKCETFDFAGWGSGSGSAAEIQAGKDFELFFNLQNSPSNNNSSVKLF